MATDASTEVRFVVAGHQAWRYVLAAAHGGAACAVVAALAGAEAQVATVLAFPLLAVLAQATVRLPGSEIGVAVSDAGLRLRRHLMPTVSIGWPELQAFSVVGDRVVITARAAAYTFRAGAGRGALLAVLTAGQKPSGVSGRTSDLRAGLLAANPWLEQGVDCKVWWRSNQHAILGVGAAAMLAVGAGSLLGLMSSFVTTAMVSWALLLSATAAGLALWCASAGSWVEARADSWGLTLADAVHTVLPWSSLAVPPEALDATSAQGPGTALCFGEGSVLLGGDQVRVQLHEALSQAVGHAGQPDAER